MHTSLSASLLTSLLASLLTSLLTTLQMDSLKYCWKLVCQFGCICKHGFSLQISAFLQTDLFPKAKKVLSPVLSTILLLLPTSQFNFTMDTNHTYQNTIPKSSSTAHWTRVYKFTTKTLRAFSKYIIVQALNNTLCSSFYSTIWWHKRLKPLS